MTASNVGLTNARATAGNRVHVDAPLSVTKKRLRNQPHGRPQRKPQPVSATHEIRRLRDQVAEMEEQLESLQLKWTTALPTPGVLETARHAAREKWMTNQVESMNAELRDELMQQQIFLASLQSVLLRAPITRWCSRDIFDGSHLNSKLDTDEALRYYQLDEHCQMGLARARAIVDHFTADIPRHAAPFSQTHMAGGLEHSFIANVLVLELEDVSVVDVFNGVLAYIAALSQETKRHTGTTLDVSPILDRRLGNRRQYARVIHDSGFYRSSTNLAIVADIVGGIGVLHTDCIIQDPLFPRSNDDTLEKITCNTVTIAPYVHPTTGRRTTVLRRIVAYRYDILPNDPILERDLKRHESIVNGDLLASVICQYLQGRQQQRRYHAIV